MVRDQTTPDKPPAQDTAHALLLGWLHDRYRPVFRRGQAIWSDVLGREVTRAECCSPPLAAIELVGRSVEAPRDRKGDVQRDGLPRVAREWLPIAYADLVAGLPEQHEAAEVVAPAAEEFTRQLSAALLSMVPLGYHQPVWPPRVASPAAV